MIKIIYGKCAHCASVNAANVITDLLKSKPDAVLGLATGSSPIGMYKELIARCNSGEISFKNVKSVNLDEYVGLSADHDQSYAYFMSHNLFNHVDIDKANTNLPNGLAEDPAAECQRYDSVVASMGGVDVQVLGIGNNGHIGFNEPADEFTVGSFKVKLTDSTIEANKIYFDEGAMPHYALTMGIEQIMRAKKIVLIATGPKKAEAIKNMVEGEVTPKVPASILQKHQDVVIFLDEAAASLLSK